MNAQQNTAARAGLSCVICHHEADGFALEKTVESLAAQTQDVETFCWSDRDIASGSRWLDFFAREVQASQIIVFLISKGLLGSPFFQNQCSAIFDQARERGARLIAVPTEKGHALEDIEELRSFEKFAVTDNALNYGSDLDVDAKYAGFASFVATSASRVLSGNNFFISHAHQDRLMADLSRARLRESGLGVWLEAEELRAGQKYSEEIQSSIRDCVAVIVIISPHAIESHWVSYECGIATGARKPIVPLLFADVDGHLGIWPQLASYQYEDFRNQAFQPWDKLIARLDDIRVEHA